MENLNRLFSSDPSYLIALRDAQPLPTPPGVQKVLPSVPNLPLATTVTLPAKAVDSELNVWLQIMVGLVAGVAVVMLVNFVQKEMLAIKAAKKDEARY